MSENAPLVIDTNPQRFGCARCPARWGGYRIAHCGSCHRTFSGIDPFDRHRAGGTCQDPATLRGVPLAPDALGVWGTGDRVVRSAPGRPARPGLSTSDEINRLPGTPDHPRER